VPEVTLLQLAVGTHQIRSDNDWSVSFDDEEETASLHRWNWLLRTTAKDQAPLSRQAGLSLMRSWIRWQSLAEGAHDAYTSGERIVNGTLSLKLTGDGDIPQDIAAAFGRMGHSVAKQLEYYPAGLTGNHAFNNARALFFAGSVSGLCGARDLALEIATERLPKLVTDDGFLREGSSHYHFLFTRWVLEMLWLAQEVGDHAFVSLLSRYAETLVRRCWFYLVYQEKTVTWEIPLVGDISPDFPPQWLLSLPWSQPACALYRPTSLPEPPRVTGWAGLFGMEDGQGKGSPSQSEEYPNSGWIRVNHGPWTVFVRAESTDGRLVAGHAHSDLTSFVLYRDGEPLIIDPGREDYTGSKTSRYGISPCAHNTVMVDGCGPVSPLGWAVPTYRAVTVDCSVHRHPDETIISIQHDGFARLSADRVSHRRSLRLTASRFDVHDEIGGGGAHDVCFRFHFAPGLLLEQDAGPLWKEANGSVGFEADPRLEVKSQIGAVEDPMGGVVSNAYGQRAFCQTLALSGPITFPASTLHSLSLEEQ